MNDAGRASNPKGSTARFRLWPAGLAIAVTLIAVVSIRSTRGPAPPTPKPPGAFAFAVLGDAPYYPWEELQSRVVRQDLAAHELSWIVHVGDIFWRPCSDEHYREYRELFDGSGHPVIYTPGDNEWTDCWEEVAGAYRPLERLDRLRRVFFDDPGRSLGRSPLALIRQAGGASYAEFVENARWVHRGIVFATLHLTGSRNGREPFPGRSEADDEASSRRMAAAVAWLRTTFEEARGLDASAVVLAFHAAPGFDEPVDDPYRQAYDPFILALEEEVERFGRPVLMTHGDDHEFVVDHPLVRRTSGRRLQNLTRMQVPGSPEVGWVRVVVRPAATDPFEFEPRVVPRWKYW